MQQNKKRKITNPRLQLTWNKLELILLFTAGLSLLATIVVVALSYGELPAEIPTHFSITGEADAFGGKSTLLWLFAIQVVLFMLLWWSICHPQYYNMPVEVTEENAERLYRLGRFSLSLINNITGWMFFYLQYKSIRIAMGQGTDLGWAMWIFIGLLMATVIYLVAQARRIA